MKGPLPLDYVQDYVRRGSIGVYVLYVNNDSVIGYVGRSDTDLLREIPYRASRREYWAGIRYHYFCFEETGSSNESYKRECELWHQFGGETHVLDQSRHPSKPKYSGCRCPVPGCRHHRRF